MSEIELALQQFERGDLTAARKFAVLVDALRPKSLSVSELDNRWSLFCHLLQGNPDYRATMHATIVDLMENSRQVGLYTVVGILPGSGFFPELSRRLAEKFLPKHKDEASLKDLICIIFPKPDDFRWLGMLSMNQWGVLFDALGPSDNTFEHTRGQILMALRVLSYRVAAAGSDTELLYGEAKLGEVTPFIEQNLLMQRFLENPGEGEEALLAHIEDCLVMLRRIQQSALERGTSITLTYNIRRLRQNLRRMVSLIELLEVSRREERRHDMARGVVELLLQLVQAENRKNNVIDHFRQNLDLLSVRVTENASKHGEHYITESRSEYIAMLRSALGGGAIMALVALDKLAIMKEHFAPMTEALLFSLNYAAGFMLVHIMGYTVATKQPAMTAAAIAASIDESGEGIRDLSRLVDLIARTVRSQLVAIFGNVVMAFPIALFLANMFLLMDGHHFIVPEKAESLLKSVDPWGATVFYAACAGGCLFLAGLIAGYYDNMSTYNRIPERIGQLRWLNYWLGEARTARVARYIGDNLGPLAGNFYLGFLLAGVGAIGVLFGLPLDIRHVTLSTGMFAFSLTALDFKVASEVVLSSMLGIAFIGMTNLTVSFTLALMVAFEARQVTFAQGRKLLWVLLRRFLTSPRDFFLPPRRD